MSNLKIDTWRDPYETGSSLTKPKTIEFNEGLTVLVGCNGTGKSTLIYNIKEYCDSINVPCYRYDNLSKGGNTSLISMVTSGFKSNYTLSDAVSLFNSSEGEAIKINLLNDSCLYDEFIKSGSYKDYIYNFTSLLGDNKKIDNKYKNEKRRVLLFDAVDSGLSVDSVVELKIFFNEIIESSKKFDKELYIIIAANEYELARESDCFDVTNGKYIRFSDYEDYREFILKSRDIKRKRLEKEALYIKKKNQKEIERLYKSISDKKEALEKLSSTGDKFRRDRLLDDIKKDTRRLEEFRNAGYEVKI